MKIQLIFVYIKTHIYFLLIFFEKTVELFVTVRYCIDIKNVRLYNTKENKYLVSLNFF